MRNLTAKILAMVMCIALIGCVTKASMSNKGEEKIPVAMGRYLEEKSGLEEIIQKQGDAYLWTDNEGKLQALIKNEQFVNYELTEDNKWEKKEMSLCDVINKEYQEIRYISYIKEGKDEGTYYLYGDMKWYEGEEKIVKDFAATIKNNKLHKINIEGMDEDTVVLGASVDNNK